MIKKIFNNRSCFSRLCIFFSLVALVSFTNKPVDIFLIGDSISIEYGPYLKKYASDFALIERKLDDGKAAKNLDIPMGANGGDSRMVLQYLKSKVEDHDFHPDYLLLNCGLHDIKRNPKTNDIAIGEDEYRNNLSAIFGLLQQERICPIWISTTWVVDSIHNEKSKAFSRFNADVIRYNKIADEVCTKYNVASIDLYSFTVKLGVNEIRDHVHYKQSAQAQQAAYMTGFIQEYIKNK